MQRSLLLLLILVLPCTAYAQVPDRNAKIVFPQEQFWIGYLNQTRLTKHIGLWLDVHHRRIDFLDRPNQNLIRGALTYYMADNVRFMAGYAFVGSYLSPSGVVRPEHRPWQQVWWSGRSGPFNMVQWMRTERRFNRRVQGDQLADGYGFNWRFRYNFLLQIPFKGQTIQPGVPNFVIQDEVFINAGKQITFNYFDQNRFFAGLSYPFNKQLLLQAGYMNLFQQLPAGNTFANNHTLRLFLFHNLDFRPQQPAP